MLLLLLGCVLEGTAIILVIVPVFIPTASALGIDLVQFGVVVVVNIMIGLITPPYGLLLFVVSKTSGALLRDIIRDTMPFLLRNARDTARHHLRAWCRVVAAAAFWIQG